MRILLAVAALSLCAAAAVARERAAPVCCDVWIFEPEQGPDSYAVARRDRSVVVAAVASAAGAQVLEGRAAEAVVRGWVAASHRGDSNSILIDARQSHVVLGGEDAGVEDNSSASEPAPAADEIDPAPGDQLIVIRNASAAQTRKFIADMRTLTPAQRAVLMAAPSR